MAERPTCNREVAGSIPVVHPTTCNFKLGRSFGAAFSFDHKILGQSEEAVKHFVALNRIPIGS